MSSAGYVAFNPNDPVQQQFLNSLALGETGTSGSIDEGYGGTDLSGAITDAFGFPVNSTTGNTGGPTSAAGYFQFEKGTWDQLAQQYGLNFADTADQEAGAWYLAQSTYASKTGGSLYSTLSSGSTGNLDSALSSIWPSVLGNGAAPQGLAASIAGGDGANLPFPDRAATPRELAHLEMLNRQHPQRTQAASSEISKTGSNASGSSSSEG
jgi:muramidase (phage lysozyme)